MIKSKHNKQMYISYKTREKERGLLVCQQHDVVPRDAELPRRSLKGTIPVSVSHEIL